MYRIESLRAYLEKELGDDPFLKVYRIIANQAQDDDDDAQEKNVEDILGKDNLGFVQLIHQLLFCENKSNDKNKNYV